MLGAGGKLMEERKLIQEPRLTAPTSPFSFCGIVSTGLEDVTYAALCSCPWKRHWRGHSALPGTLLGPQAGCLQGLSHVISAG